MSEVDYSYVPPEKVFVNEGGLLEAITPALLSQQMLNDKAWNEQRLASRQQNLKDAHGVFVNGVYHHHP